MMFNVISHLNPTSTERVKCVLQWIGFSKNPLKRLELLSAVTFSEGGAVNDRLVPFYFLQDCSSLLEEKGDDTVSFIHASVKEFLLDPESPICISQEDAQRQHARGILTCLASAASHFDRPDIDANTQLLVVRSVFAFLNYASKHWTDYVLTHAEARSRGGVYDAQIVETADRLATVLHRLVPAPDANPTNLQCLDPRLKALENLSSIRPHVEMALIFQSQEAIEKAVTGNNQQSSTRVGQHELIDAVSVLLQRYQDAVQSLLRQGYYPGVAMNDFKLFRSQALASLFTCRLPLCPIALVGYKTEAELRAHELEHINGLPCRVTGCMYPPFRTAQLLENHIKKHHCQVPPKRNLRRVREFCHKPKSAYVARSAPETAVVSNSMVTSQGANPALLQGQPNHPQSSTQLGQPRLPIDSINKLTADDRAKILDMAKLMYQQGTELQRQSMRATMSPAQLQKYHAIGKDPVFVLYLNHAFNIHYASKISNTKPDDAGTTGNPLLIADDGTAPSSQPSLESVNRPSPGKAQASFDQTGEGEDIKMEDFPRLSDYQLQLMLLKQQNKKRKKMAKMTEQGE